MVQVKVNGSVVNDQFLTQVLDWFVLDAVDSIDLSNVGYTGGNAGPGEEAYLALSEVANPVIWEQPGGNTRLAYFATEVDGITAASLQAAVRLSATFPNATVASGSLTVV